jgi:hypothetical protein
LFIDEDEDPLITKDVVESTRLWAKDLEDIRMYARCRPDPSSLYPDAQADYGAGNINRIPANIQHQLAQIGETVEVVQSQVLTIGRAEHQENGRYLCRLHKSNGRLGNPLLYRYC